MAIRSGFFNSVNGDRKYDARRFAEYFASFIGNGVFPNPSNNLQVLSNDDMTVTVKAGKAWINGYILINDDDYILTLDPADGVLNRIDRIVARYDTVDREIRLEVKKGTFASSPVAPTLQRDADAYELGLADVYIAAGVVSVTQANITDLRFNTELCGIVKGTVDQIDTTDLFAQYQTAFNDWFQELKDTLDDNTAANLLNLINQLDDDLAAHKADNFYHIPYVIATGTNSYAVNIQGITALTEGMSVKVKFVSANTGACTLNINGLGAKEIRKSNGNALSAGNIKAGQILHLVYTGSVFQLLGEGGEYGTAQPEHVLEGYTIGTEEGIKSGTMPNRGAINQTLTTQGGSYTIPQGYHNGSGKVTASFANLVAGNIKKGVNIGGVVGTLEPKLIASGTVTGTQGETKTIITGFRPETVVIFSIADKDSYSYFRGAFTFNGTVYYVRQGGTGLNYIKSIDSNGFTIGFGSDTSPQHLEVGYIAVG